MLELLGLIGTLIGAAAAVFTLFVVLYQLYESKRRVDIDFSEEARHVNPWPGPMPVADFRVTNLRRTPQRFTGCWYEIARGERLVQFESHGEEAWTQPDGLSEPVATGVSLPPIFSLIPPLARRLMEERYVFEATLRFVVEDNEGRRYGKTVEIRDLPAWAKGRRGSIETRSRGPGIFRA